MMAVTRRHRWHPGIAYTRRAWTEYRTEARIECRDCGAVMRWLKRRGQTKPSETSVAVTRGQRTVIGTLSRMPIYSCPGRRQ